jgi:hypothetical protein
MTLNEGPTVERVTTRIMERLSANDTNTDDTNDLAAVAAGVAALHGESVSKEMMDTVLADIELKSAS